MSGALVARVWRGTLSGPAPGFSSRGGTFLKYSIGCM